jgi:hypothetical protein
LLSTKRVHKRNARVAAEVAAAMVADVAVIAADAAAVAVAVIAEIVEIAATAGNAHPSFLISLVPCFGAIAHAPEAHVPLP